jgi:hypothetical protein
MVIEGGCHATGITHTTSSSSRLPAGDDVPAGTVAVVRSPLALRCSTEQNALHTLIHQRHLTPSCGGHAPTAERTLDPARMIRRELDPRPGIRELNRHNRITTFRVPAYQRETTSLPGRWRWCDRPRLCDARRAKRASHIDPPASSYAIVRRARPYRGENPEPGKDVHGELDAGPELENSLGP